MSGLTDERAAAGHLWRKQVLPLGEISYKGRTLAFTPGYLGGLAEAFAGDAFTLVPFQLAVSSGHTNDPRRRRGSVFGLEVVPDGLDALIAATDEGNAVILADRGLGAAPRIIEDYRRADGHLFPAAIQHILGTTKPLITGLRPWCPVTVCA